MKRIFAIVFTVISIQLVCGVLCAKVPDLVKQQFLAKFTPAVYHWALENAHENPNPAKLRGYVVLVKDNVPAGRAYWFITMSEYEYRPVDIEGEQLKTYRGEPYVYLRSGEPLIITDVSFTSRTIYMKLLSDDVLTPEGRKEKHPSRASVVLGFKFPKGVIEDGKMDEIFKAVEDWVRPFQDASSARQYAASITGEGGKTLPVDLAPGDPQSHKKAALAAVPVSKPQPVGLPVVKEGSTVEEVVKVFGEPSGKAEVKDMVLYKYSDMTVVFKNGRLVEVKLK